MKVNKTEVATAGGKDKAVGCAFSLNQDWCLLVYLLGIYPPIYTYVPCTFLHVFYFTI